MASQPLAIVTGAAHRLGKAFATLLARKGYAVLLHYWKSDDEARATAEELRGLGGEVFVAKVDLAMPTGFASLFSKVDQLPHTLKVLVNSAGLIRRGEPRTLSIDDWDELLNLNLRAPFFCAREAAARMAEGGLIVNITDVGARKTWSKFPAYSVSKAGMEMLTGILARSFAPQVRVNAIAPGLVLPSAATTEREWRQLIQRLPIKRAGTTEEIAKAFEFLLENEYVTGQSLVVDGGYSLLG
jgi:NAD(P)-dependent dehydrogenase (short-subunit alcohol dehydrogenase family)